MKRKRIQLILLLIILLAFPLLVLAIKHQTQTRSNAAAADKLEAEGGVLGGNAQSKTDSLASGGSYVLLGINQNQTSGIGPQTVTSTPLSSGTKFVSPSGNGTTCSQANPCSLSTVVANVNPGDVVFMRGGIYPITSVTKWDRNGTATNPIIIESYPGETAIWDGSNQPINSANIMLVGGNYYKFRKFEIRNMPGMGIYITGSNNFLDGVYSHHNKVSGIYINFGNNNTVQNSIASDNSDAGLTNDDYRNGGNADGIGISSGDGNKVINCLTARNSDDGTDAWTSTNTVISYSIATANGLGQGDGNGFKLGGASPTNGTKIDHSVAYQNKVTGFDANSGTNITINFVTSWNNGDYGIFPVSSTTVTNSISVNNTTGNIYPNGNQTNNSWQRSGTPNFMSTDPTSPNFLKPTSGGGFEDIGAYAGSSSIPTSIPTKMITLAPTNTQTPTPTTSSITYDAIYIATSSTDQTVALANFLSSHAHQHVALSGIIPVTNMIFNVPAGTPTIIDFLPGAKVQGILTGAHGVFRLNNCFDIVLNNPNIAGTGYAWVGDPVNHQDPNQNEAGIFIDGGGRITINHPIIRDTRGDGIYIDSRPGTNLPPIAVAINNSDIARSSRNGISPLAGEVTIKGGTIDRSGLFSIDFEPNNDTGATSIIGTISDIRLTHHDDLPDAAVHGNYQIAAGGYSSATKKKIDIQRVSGDNMIMTIRNTANVIMKDNFSDTAASVDFPGSTVTTFTNNTNITRR